MRGFSRMVAGLLVPLALSAAPARSEPATRFEGSGSLQALAPDGQAIGVCPLRHTAVSAEIAGFVARVTVTQRFENPFADPIEAIYTFPLSDGAAVDAMRVSAGEREIRGEVRRREEARRLYEEAKSRGQLAALLDEERPNVFTQAIANLMPGERVEVRIEYVETLRYEEGSFEFSFPTVVGPRFVPGGGRVPDAARIAPPITPEGTRAGHDIAIDVAIDAGVPIFDIESKLHAITVTRDSSHRARVALMRQAELPNRDFVLRWAVARDQVESGYLTHRNGGDGYLTLVLVPPKRVTPQTAAPKELVFVIDRSGSQRGLPLAKARETMLWIIDRLNPRDTFQIVSFSMTTEMLFERPRPVTPETRRRARDYVAGLRANGGTMLAEAVQRVASTRAEGNRLRVVTFMTDGYVGNDFEVIDLVKRLRGTSRWFPFGTGNSVNRFLLDNMASQGGGEVEYVLLDDPGEEVARRFYERIASPVLTDVSVEFRGVEVTDVLPYQLSDLWAERPLIIQARYRSAARGRAILSGFRAGEAWREEIDLDLPSRRIQNAGIASVWARRRVEDLMQRDLRSLQSGRFPDSLKEEIVEVALEHGILSPFTSFVAVEDRVVNEGGEPRTVTVPVEIPQGVTYEGVFGADYEMSARVSQTQPGAGSVLGSLREALPRRAPSTEARQISAAEEPARESDPIVRRRLAPELLALVEGRADAATLQRVVSERISVRVILREASDEWLLALREAGLQIRVRTRIRVIGEIDVSALRALARVDGVERVELP